MDDEQTKDKAREDWREKMWRETEERQDRLRQKGQPRLKEDESKKTEQVNIIGLSWRYLASQAVSQLGRYQCEYKFRSFYFTAHLVFSLSCRPPTPVRRIHSASPRQRTRN